MKERQIEDGASAADLLRTDHPDWTEDQVSEVVEDLRGFARLVVQIASTCRQHNAPHLRVDPTEQILRRLNERLLPFKVMGRIADAGPENAPAVALVQRSRPPASDHVR